MFSLFNFSNFPQTYSIEPKQPILNELILLTYEQLPYNLQTLIKFNLTHQLINSFNFLFT
jgi:hypothetical protein